MAQLNTDLETIKTARDNMKTALEGQGQTVTKDIRTYAQAIANLEQNVELDLSKAISSSTNYNTDMNLLKKCITKFGDSIVFDLDGSINAGFLFSGCTKLTKIPTLRNTNSLLYCHYMFGYMYDVSDLPYFDTSSVKNFYDFAINSHFVNVPILNLQSATNLQGMFSGCTYLNNDSLNNIMEMCIGATSYGSTKTLKYIGLTSDQTTICQGLSNYQDFIDAGWTTGY